MLWWKLEAAEVEGDALPGCAVVLGLKVLEEVVAGEETSEYRLEEACAVLVLEEVELFREATEDIIWNARRQIAWRGECQDRGRQTWADQGYMYKACCRCRM